jgi:16S rRNA U1498 N3-methylase RsmE
VDAACAAGALAVDLGPTILRVETAAVAMAAALRLPG